MTATGVLHRASYQEARWCIDVLAFDERLVSVERTAGGLVIQAGRAGGDHPAAPCDGDDGFVVLTLAADGAAVVRATCAPPAILLSGDRATALSGATDGDGHHEFRPGERLLVCTSPLLDSTPAGLSLAVHDPARACLASADALLMSVLGDARDGAVVVVSRAAADGSPTATTTTTTTTIEGDCA